MTKETELIRGSEALIRALLDSGVTTIFGYPGGQIMPVYDSLYDYTDRITHLLARHEQGAIHAAQGYARASGKPGVVISTSGPGATNLITGLSDAMIDSTPLVVITGQVPSSLLGKDAFQEADVIGMTQPMTKWSVQIERAEDISAAVARAFYIASSGRPGPVVIDFTRDAQIQLTEYHFELCRFIRSYNPEPHPKTDDIRLAAKMINAARRPMILSGQGVTLSRAERELREFAEKGDIPVACTMLGLSSIPTSHPLYKGMLGMHGNIGPNINTNRADLIIAVGMRFDDRVTGDVSSYAPNAKIIHIDIDESEFDKTVISSLHLHGDAGEVLRDLIPLIDPAIRGEWNASFDTHRKIEESEVINREINPPQSKGAMQMGEVVRKVSQAYSDDAILVTDVGMNQLFAVRYFGFRSPRSCITSGGLGTMGFGLPAAIGAKWAVDERPVVLFVGDGGFQMTIQELGMIMEYGIAVKIVLLNNNFLGNVRQWQHLFFNRRYSFTPMFNPDFISVAAAYGISGEDVSDRSQLDAAIQRMIESDGAYLLNVNIDPDDLVFPMTPGGAAVDTIMLNPTDYYRPAE